MRSPVGGIAGEADAGAGVLAQVAENHGLHVDRGAQPVVDVVDAAIGLGALILPAPEDRVAGLHQLIERVLGKLLVSLFLDQLLVLGDDFLQRIGSEFVIELHALAMLDGVENVFELLLFNVENHIAKHLNQAAVGVISEAGIIAASGQRFDCLIVEAQVENGVHHAGHGELGAGADRDEEGIFALAEFLPLQLLKPLQGSVHLNIDLGADGAAHVFAAGFSLDGEPRGNRQTGICHFGQAGTLAAQSNT